jgi:hypothetical protein
VLYGVVLIIVGVFVGPGSVSIFTETSGPIGGRRVLNPSVTLQRAGVGKVTTMALRWTWWPLRASHPDSPSQRSGADTPRAPFHEELVGDLLQVAGSRQRTR